MFIMVAGIPRSFVDFVSKGIIFVGECLSGWKDLLERKMTIV
jgi:hypothetical protein